MSIVPKVAGPFLKKAIQTALIAGGGGGLFLAADQMGVVDSLLGTEPAAVSTTVAPEMADVVSQSIGRAMVGGTYEGMSWAVHGAVDVVLYPFKVAAEGF